MPLTPEEFETELADVDPSTAALIRDLQEQIAAIPPQPTQAELAATMAMNAALVGKVMTLDETATLALLATLTATIEGAS